ncbi:multidrug efflux SMR transporter [Streptomyces sp. NPDC007861]|uniref:DMT family transporter n=1 Tax=Streptomyces sp. NPDC007861 TaxID=3154893 RepID=UPI0033CA151F
MSWLFLGLAILTEVIATLCLRASEGGRHKAWLAPVVLGYVASFAFLSLALHRGVAIGVAYGIWTAVGVALTAIASRFLFHEPLTRLMGVGIALIAAGVVLIDLGETH